MAQGRPAGRVAIIGGGVSGLAAAHRVRILLGPECAVTVFEASGRVGGKLRTGRVAGVPLDVGAEAFLARRPEVPELLRELGLEAETVHPAGRSPRLRAGGRLHPVPGGTLMGIPAQPSSLTGLLGEAAAEAQRRDARPLQWAPGFDTSVGALVSERFGPEVVRRCVDPLLGGVYSGTAETIGVRSALPGLAAALDAGAPSLGRAVADAQSAARPGEGPVFGALRGGYARLIEALVRAGGAAVRTGTAVTGLAREGSGSAGRWRLTLAESGGGAAVPDPTAYDAVILALPAPASARLLGGVAPGAAREAARIPLADSAVVALALPDDVALPDASGVLVATGEPGVGAKACTLSGNKWPHLDAQARAAGAQVLRLSYGRFGDSDIVRAPDAALLGQARRDLHALLGVDAAPVDAHVQRWYGGLPQYGPGHDGRVAAVEAATAQVPGLALAGSAWHGVGVPACVGGARTAAETVAAGLRA